MLNQVSTWFSHGACRGVNTNRTRRVPSSRDAAGGLGHQDAGLALSKVEGVSQRHYDAAQGRHQPDPRIGLVHVQLGHHEDPPGASAAGDRPRTVGGEVRLGTGVGHVRADDPPRGHLDVGRRHLCA